MPGLEERVANLEVRVTNVESRVAILESRPSESFGIQASAFDSTPAGTTKTIWTSTDFQIGQDSFVNFPMVAITFGNPVPTDGSSKVEFWHQELSPGNTTEKFFEVDALAGASQVIVRPNPRGGLAAGIHRFFVLLRANPTEPLGVDEAMFYAEVKPRKS